MTKYDTFLINKTIDEVITLTTCIQLKLKDGTIKGFTEHNEDIIIDNILYKKESESFHIKIDKNCSWYCLNICGIVRAHQSLMDP